MPQLPSFLTRLSPFSPPSTAGDTPVAAAQGPAAKSVREAQQSPEFETARRCVAADWWPHGLGLHVDEGELRHEFEPREGPLSARVPIDLSPYRRGEAVSSEVVAIEGGRDGKTTQHRQAGGLFKGGAGERAAAAVQAETAQRLGAVLLQRFDWTRPIALEPAPFKALAQALSEPSLTSRSWSLRAQSDRGDVQLLLHTLTGDRSLGTVLKAGPHAQGVAIFRPRPDDNLASAAQGLAQRHNGAARLEDRFLLPASMSGARAGQRLAALDREGRASTMARSIRRTPRALARCGSTTARRRPRPFATRAPPTRRRVDRASRSPRVFPFTRCAGMRSPRRVRPSAEK
ncbi:hypothetical protein ACNI65_10995 [Roseateles sp. So40a]|uniref:hypothetical protein n=1 Tax=Roseateles sp. So40a TaxID=3400226 RepID=UPI003A863543